MVKRQLDLFHHKCKEKKNSVHSKAEKHAFKNNRVIMTLCLYYSKSLYGTPEIAISCTVAHTEFAFPSTENVTSDFSAHLPLCICEQPHGIYLM